MLHSTHTFELFRIKSTEPLRETPVHVRGLSIGRFYLPPGHSLSFPPPGGVQRLHVILGGRGVAEWGGTSLTVGPTRALTVGQQQELKVTSTEGLVLISLVFRGDETESPVASSGFTVFDLGAPNTTSLAAEMGHWAQVAPVSGRLRIQPLSGLGSAVDESSPRHLLFLGEGAHLQVENDDFFPRMGDVITVPTGVPHTLYPLAGSVCLILRENGPATEVYLPRCGRRASRCQVAETLGFEALVLDVMGGVLSRNRGAATSQRGWCPEVGSNLMDELDPTSASWLKLGLGRSDSEVSRGELSLVDGTHNLQVVLQPYGGYGEERTFLLYFSPIERSESNRAPAEAAAILPRVWHQTLQKFCADRQWIIVWGASASDRLQFALALHQLSPWVSRPSVLVDASSETPASLEDLLRRGRVDLPDVCLTRQQGGTVVVSGLSSWPAFRRVEALQRLSRLNEDTYAASCRLVLLLDKRPGRGLVGGEAHGGQLERGPFVVVRLPSLGDMAGDLPLFVTKMLGERLPTRVLTPDGVEWLKSQPWEGGLTQLMTLVDWLKEQSRPVSAEQLAHFGTTPVPGEEDIPTLDEALRDLLTRTLQVAGGNRAKAARLLGITRPRLYRLVAEYRLESSLTDQ